MEGRWCMQKRMFLAQVQLRVVSNGAAFVVCRKTWVGRCRRRRGRSPSRKEKSLLVERGSEERQRAELEGGDGDGGGYEEALLEEEEGRLASEGVVGVALE